MELPYEVLSVTFVEEDGGLEVSFLQPGLASGAGVVASSLQFATTARERHMIESVRETLCMLIDAGHQIIQDDEGEAEDGVDPNMESA